MDRKPPCSSRYVWGASSMTIVNHCQIEQQLGNCLFRLTTLFFSHSQFVFFNFRLTKMVVEVSASREKYKKMVVEDLKQILEKYFPSSLVQNFFYDWQIIYHILFQGKLHYHLSRYCKTTISLKLELKILTEYFVFLKDFVFFLKTLYNGIFQSFKNLNISLRLRLVTEKVMIVLCQT